ncbi:MAG: serine hydrolase domain-containing protein, partial [Planctomycetota bacterium]
MIAGDPADQIVVSTAPNLPACLDAYIQRRQSEYGNPGVALAVLRNGQVLHKKYYGFANLEHRVVVSESTSFRLFSLTKPFISVGVFQLMESGKLKIDQPISDFLHDLPPAWRRVEIQHL